MDPAHVPVGDACCVSDDQDANSVPKGMGNDLTGCLVVGLVDAATMQGLSLPLPGSVAAPSSRAPLPGLGSPARRPGLTGSLIVQVKMALSANCAARDQQARLLADDRIGVDHAEVHTCDPVWVQVVRLDGNRGGDRQPQLTAVGEQDDRPDLFGRVGRGRAMLTQRAGQPLATGSHTRRCPSSWNVPL